MLRRVKKGKSVIGMRAVMVKDWTFYKGHPLVRGYYGENDVLTHGAHKKRQNVSLL